MDCPGYRHWARAPADTRIYAIGDLHGQLELLDEMHDLIRQDAETAAQGLRLLIVYLGDYIDRGPRSSEVVGRLLDNPMRESFETIYLRGNHEDFMLGFVDSGVRGGPWLRLGGRETLQSYGLEMPGRAADDDLLATRAALILQLPPAHLAFLKATEVMHCEGDYLFAHAGIRPGIGMSEQDPHDFMWIRSEFTNSNANFGVCVVHGHTIRERPTIAHNRIGVDTGAYYTGVLSCAVIEDDFVRFLHTPASGVDGGHRQHIIADP